MNEDLTLLPHWYDPEQYRRFIREPEALFPTLGADQRTLIYFQVGARLPRPKGHRGYWRGSFAEETLAFRTTIEHLRDGLLLVRIIVQDHPTIPPHEWLFAFERHHGLWEGVLSTRPDIHQERILGALGT